MADGTIEGIVPDAAIQAVLGERIGTGTAREAYTYAGEPDRIVKVSRGPAHTSNQTEWLIWTQAAAHAELAKILGQCFAISQSGKYLVMEHMRDLTDEEKQTPALCPSWVTDVKPSAFGKSADDRVKLRDYGQVNIGAALAGVPIVSRPLKADIDMAHWAKLVR